MRPIVSSDSSAYPSTPTEVRDEVVRPSPARRSQRKRPIGRRERGHAPRTSARARTRLNVTPRRVGPKARPVTDQPRSLQRSRRGVSFTVGVPSPWCSRVTGSRGIEQERFGRSRGELEPNPVGGHVCWARPRVRTGWVGPGRPEDRNVCLRNGSVLSLRRTFSVVLGCPALNGGITVPGSGPFELESLRRNGRWL